MQQNENKIINNLKMIKQESDRIKSLFPILNHRLKMKNVYWSIVHLKDAIEMMKSGNSIEFYEKVLKQLEDEKNK